MQLKHRYGQMPSQLQTRSNRFLRLDLRTSVPPHSGHIAPRLIFVYTTYRKARGNLELNCKCDSCKKGVVRPAAVRLAAVRLMLLTNVPIAAKDSQSLWWIVQIYLTRWKIEETFRLIKRSYNLEDIRVMKYQRLKNLVILVTFLSSR